jgi:hypothetical protein
MSRPHFAQVSELLRAFQQGMELFRLFHSLVEGL